MKLSSLLEKIEYQILQGKELLEKDPDVLDLCRDNRKAEQDQLFICTKGANFDSHDESVVKGLYEKGVRFFVVEQAIQVPADALVLLVENTRVAAAYLYAAWFGNPAEKLTVIGITGSKGKTTTTHMLANVLMAAGHRVGTMGTNGAIYGDTQIELRNTTPDSNEVQYYLSEMVKAGCDTCVLEVSSQAMKMHRVDGFTFDYGVWMNIQEGDHIGPNEHESFEDYMACKAELLNHSRVRFVHEDDPFVNDFLSYVKGDYKTFGANATADYQATDIQDTFDETTQTPGLSFDVLQKGEIQKEAYWSNFPGDFNAWNALAAIAVAKEMGVETTAIQKGLQNVRIRGRNDLVYRGKFTVCVDFAHNGASTWHHLEAVKKFRPKRIICIFGADGNRSKGRRYGMGEAAGTLADLAIVTSGHNRFETFEQILADTEVGLKKAPHPNYIAIKDRETAIRYAIDNAKEGDFITIIGLGHESWQEENGVKRKYADIEFVKQVIQEKGL